MSVRILTGHGLHADGIVSEDFELLPDGTITNLPEVTGLNGMIIRQGHSIPRQG